MGAETPLQGGCNGPAKRVVGRALVWVNYFSDGSYTLEPCAEQGADPLLDVKEALEALNGMLPAEKQVSLRTFYNMLDDGRISLETTGQRAGDRMIRRRVRLSSLVRYAKEVSPKSGQRPSLN